jgi:hypothetical protein
MSRLQDVIQRGTRASQPAATAVSNGTLYYVTDEKIMERSTGAAWQAVAETFTGDSGSGGTKGLVPAPASGDTTAGKFLKADGTWAVPSGGGGGAITYDFKGTDETRGNTASVVADDANMRVTLGVGTHYVKVYAITTQTTNNGDFRWSLQFSGTASSVSLMRTITNNGTSSYAHVTSLSNGTANDIAANAVGVIEYEGQIVVSSGGDLELKWTGDDTAVNTTLKASSYIAYKTH